MLVIWCVWMCVCVELGVMDFIVTYLGKSRKRILVRRGGVGWGGGGG